MSSFTKYIYGISSKTETTVEPDRVTIKSRLTENFILLLLLVLIYLLITDAAGGILFTSRSFTAAYFIFGILLILSYRRIIVIDSMRREISRKVRLIVNLQRVYGFDELNEVVVEKKMKTITGVTLPIPVEVTYLTLLLRNGKKIFIDKSTDSEYISNCRDSITRLLGPTNSDSGLR